MELIVLGTSSALPTSERYPSAHVLNVHERFFLIDCGEGTQMQLRRNRITLSKIDNIFISHLHGDHIFGLYGLISTYCLLKRETPLNIYAPEKLGELLMPHLSDLGIHPEFELNFINLEGDEPIEIFSNRSMTVTAFPLEHRIPTYGFLFKEKPRERNIIKEYIDKYNISVPHIKAIKKGADFVTEDGVCLKNEEITTPGPPPLSYAYCSDPMYTSRLAPIIKDVTLLYHEATYDQAHIEMAISNYHSTAKEAARVAKDAGAQKLLIGHFSSRFKDADPLVEEAREIFSETYAAEEGKSYIVGE